MGGRRQHGDLARRVDDEARPARQARQRVRPSLVEVKVDHMRSSAMSGSLDRRRCLIGLGAVAAAALLPARAASGKGTSDLRVATALELAAGLRAGLWSARELAQHYLARIEALNGPFERFDDNGALNAFIRTYPDLARRSWERADRARTYTGWSGVPLALKDIFAVEGKPVTAGTPAHRSYRPGKDCTSWRRWAEAGAVLLGHTQAQRF